MSNTDSDFSTAGTSTENLGRLGNKIVGSADAVLESYNTPLNWDCISKCLTLPYADKKDLTTLEYQMTTLFQRNRWVQEFYQEVCAHLLLIMNKLSCLNANRKAKDLLTQTYRNKALDTFIRRLKAIYPDFWLLKNQQIRHKSSICA